MMRAPLGAPAALMIDTPEELRLIAPIALDFLEQPMAPFLRLSLGAFALVSVGAGPAGAGAPLQDAPPAETRINPYAGDPPPCDHDFVLAHIMRDFADREKEYWGGALSIETFSDARETGFRKHGASFIPRRSCEAHVLLSDGASRRLTYEIAEGQGFLGLGFGVRWRVHGLDPERGSSDR
jgi:hypothetical protein